MFGALQLGLGLTRRQGGGVFAPSDLFQTGDILLWYDPSDLTTMFTNTTGTTQVAADGNSVALMLDKGQWGGKTLEQVLAAQPELRDTSSAGTVTGSWTESGGVVTAPGSSGLDNVTFPLTTPTVVGRHYEVLIPNTLPGGGFYVDFGSGSGSQVGNLGLSVQRIILTCTVSTSVVRVGRWSSTPTGTIGPISVKEIPGCHRTQATGTSMPKYKTDGTRHWLLYDGTDDSSQTPTITWGTDEVAMCAGLTKSSDSPAGIFAEFSPISSANVGSFYLAAPEELGGSSDFSSNMRGSATPAKFDTGAILAPATKVVTIYGDISASNRVMRIDGAVAATSASWMGTGNFGSYAMNFGRRNGASIPFNGREYQTVIRSRLLSTAELSSLETFIAEKTGVIL